MTVSARSRLKRLLRELEGVLADQDGHILEIAISREDAELIATAFSKRLSGGAKGGQSLDKSFGFVTSTRGRKRGSVIDVEIVLKALPHILKQELAGKRVMWKTLAKRVGYGGEPATLERTIRRYRGQVPKVMGREISLRVASRTKTR